MLSVVINIQISVMYLKIHDQICNNTHGSIKGSASGRSGGGGSV